MVEVVVPSPGESITEVTLGTWRKSDGDWVEKDELLNEIDSDKATLELLSPASGAIRLVVKSGTEQKSERLSQILTKQQRALQEQWRQRARKQQQ